MDYSLATLIGIICALKIEEVQVNSYFDFYDGMFFVDIFLAMSRHFSSRKLETSFTF